MDFTFTATVPATTGRSHLDYDRAENLINALIDNPGQWAQVPITYLYPDLEGAEHKRVLGKTRNTASAISKGRLQPFCEYRCEARSRDTDLYIRINLTLRERRALEKED